MPKDISWQDILNNIKAENPNPQGPSSEAEQAAAVVEYFTNLLKDFNRNVSLRNLMTEIYAFSKNEVAPLMNSLDELIIARRNNNLVNLTKTYKTLLANGLPESFAQQMLLLQMTQERNTLDSFIEYFKSSSQQASVNKKG